MQQFVVDGVKATAVQIDISPVVSAGRSKMVIAVQVPGMAESVVLTIQDKMLIISSKHSEIGEHAQSPEEVLCLQNDFGKKTVELDTLQGMMRMVIEEIGMAVFEL